MQDTAILDALQSYKNLAEDVASHDKLLKDKTILLYAATMLENANDDIVTSSLEILSMLANHDKNHEVLLNTFGIFEALENVAINYRKDKPKLSNFASEIVNKLRQNAPPAYRTRLRVKNGNSNIRKNASFMYLLQVDSLNEDTRLLFESTLLEIKGVISFVVDMAARRCTIRIAPRMNVKTVISRIRENADMKTVLVTKNQYDGTEVPYKFLMSALLCVEYLAVIISINFLLELNKMILYLIILESDRNGLDNRVFLYLTVVCSTMAAIPD